MLYNIKFKPHKRTSLLVDNLPDCIVEAKNAASAKELGHAIVRDYYLQKNPTIYNDDYMTKQYSYIIEKEAEQNVF